MRPIGPSGFNVAIHPVLHCFGGDSVVRLTLTLRHLAFGAEPSKVRQFIQHPGVGISVIHAGDSNALQVRGSHQ